MLRKNVYLLYPAGYTGNYINWIINVSDKHLAEHAVKDPITQAGNTHGHIRIPTHQNFNKTMTWMLYNQPKEKKIYPINVIESSKDYPVKAAYAVQNILRFDSDPVIINIHDNNDLDIRKFAAINMVTKWSVYLQVQALWHNDYNPLVDPDENKAIDWLADNWKTAIVNNPPLNRDEVNWHLQKQNRWFELRHNQAPWEVTQDQYLLPHAIPDSVYDISVKDITQHDFIYKIADILEHNNVADFNFEHVHNFHSTFVEKQPNLVWFDDIDFFRKTGTASPWLLSHRLTRAFLLEEGKLKNPVV